MKFHDWQKTYWQDEHGNKTTIQDVLLELQHQHAVDIKLADLAHIPSTYIDPHRKMVADLSCPIIVLEKHGTYQSILDGHHRRQKAIEEKRTHVLAKVYRGEVFDGSR